MSTKLRNSLGSLLTVFSLDAHKNEIEELISGTRPDVEREEQDLARALTARLMNLAPRSFEMFCTDILRTVGFQAATTPYVRDKGVDITGTLNVEGLASITLQVQVKRVAGSIGSREVQNIRGTLERDEQGAIITTSKFTQPAREEAQTPGKKPIALIDGDALVELILTHFDELAQETREFLRLRRKEVPLHEQFVFESS